MVLMICSTMLVACTNQTQSLKEKIINYIANIEQENDLNIIEYIRINQEKKR